MKALSNEQMDFFRREGYLMVPDVFERDDLTPLRDELTGVNVDEELVNLIEYEQAFQAASQFIRVMSEVGEELMALV